MELLKQNMSAIEEEARFRDVRVQELQSAQDKAQIYNAKLSLAHENAKESHKQLSEKNKTLQIDNLKAGVQFKGLTASKMKVERTLLQIRSELELSQQHLKEEEDSVQKLEALNVIFEKTQSELLMQVDTLQAGITARDLEKANDKTLDLLRASRFRVVTLDGQLKKTKETLAAADAAAVQMEQNIAQEKRIRSAYLEECNNLRALRQTRDENIIELKDIVEQQKQKIWETEMKYQQLSATYVHMLLKDASNINRFFLCRFDADKSRSRLLERHLRDEIGKAEMELRVAKSQQIDSLRLQNNAEERFVKAHKVRYINSLYIFAFFEAFFARSQKLENEKRKALSCNWCTWKIT